jgi:hypothetical protein
MALIPEAFTNKSKKYQLNLDHSGEMATNTIFNNTI